MYDVDDEAVSGGPHGDWPRAHQQGDDVKQVGQVAHHVQRVVERQHQQVPATTNHELTSLLNIPPEIPYSR